MFGFRAGDAASIDLRALLPDLQITAPGADLAGTETTARRLDGKAFVAEAAVGKAQVDSRSVYVAVIRDASPRRQAEQWRKEHEAELAHATRLTTTGEMAAALAHELNQPLTAAIGFARACQGLLQGPSSGEAATHREAIELIENTVQQATRAGRIIRSTREFLKRDDMQSTKVTLAEMVDTVLDLLRAEAVQHRVRIITRVEPNLPPVFVDPIQIEQVILNLLRNSIEAMVRAETSRREITLTVRRAADASAYAEVEIRDSGPGFAAEVADRLFEPFSTTKGGGMGLGLSISRSIVEGHGGRISAVTADGPGAVIRFTLPLDSETDAQSA
jgi:two-component system sensor kinase FixL